MNQSWELMRKVAPAIDGVMLEGFSASYDHEIKRYRRNPSTWDDDGLAKVKQYILPLQKEHPGVRLLVLDYAEPDATEMIQAAKDRAATFGFLHCIAPVQLDAIYDADRKIVGKSDAKWWEKQAKPEDITLTLDSPRNGFPAGTRVIPSGCFLGYAVAPIVDGLDDRAGFDWSKVAWASAEEQGEPAWVELQLPEARVGGRLGIEWEKGHASRDFDVETRSAPNGQWSRVARVRDNREPTCTINLPREPYRYIRIHQPPGGGSKARPNLMWIARVRWLERG
jgi:hypothetical protein